MLVEVSEESVMLFVLMMLPSLSHTVQSAMSPVLVTMPVHLRHSSSVLQAVEVMASKYRVKARYFMIVVFAVD